MLRNYDEKSGTFTSFALSQEEPNESAPPKEKKEAPVEIELKRSGEHRTIALPEKQEEGPAEEIIPEIVIPPSVLAEMRRTYSDEEFDAAMDEMASDHPLFKRTAAATADPSQRESRQSEVAQPARPRPAIVVPDLNDALATISADTPAMPNGDYVEDNEDSENSLKTREGDVETQGITLESQEFEVSYDSAKVESRIGEGNGSQDVTAFLVQVQQQFMTPAFAQASANEITRSGLSSAKLPVKITINIKSQKATIAFNSGKAFEGRKRTGATVTDQKIANTIMAALQQQVQVNIPPKIAAEWNGENALREETSGIKVVHKRKTFTFSTMVNIVAVNG